MLPSSFSVESSGALAPLSALHGLYSHCPPSTNEPPPTRHPPTTTIQAGSTYCMLVETTVEHDTWLENAPSVKI